MNPLIGGSLTTIHDAKDQLEAAEKMWLGLTEHMVSYMPRFRFTMKDIKNNSLHSFEVNENGVDGSYKIVELKTTNKKALDQFIKNVDQFDAKVEKQQTGGAKAPKRRRYEDDSSSSEEENYPRLKRYSPISIFHYTPTIYNDLDAVLVEQKTTLNPSIGNNMVPIYTPLFKSPLSPFVLVWQ
jgi:hypothetical protein